MRSISRAISRLHEDGAWFARASELRLLLVRTSADLRKPALKHLQQLEFHADTRSPWVTLDAPRTGEDDGWQARANALTEDWGRRRQAFADAGVELPALATSGAGPEAPAASAVEARLAPFASTAAAVLGASREPLRGLVLLLAPAAVDDPAAFEEELDVLLRVPSLAGCRWILVLDEDLEPPRGLLAALGDRALECDARVDPAAFERDVEELVAGGDVRAGMAGPRGVVPPRRVDDPAEPSEAAKAERDEALRKAGIDPRYLVEAPRLRTLVVGAALAMKQGRGPEAVRLQREACDLCDALAMHQVKVVCQIALASYLSGLGQEPEALRELEAAATHAKAHALPVQESQAHLALGLLHALAQRAPEATGAYVQAARAAEAGASPLLAIEAWRLAGQLAAQQELSTAATRAFKEAIRIASGADPALAQVSSAPEAARALAALCRQHQLAAQADSLEAQARAMEQGEVATVTAGGAPAPGRQAPGPGGAA